MLFKSNSKHSKRVEENTLRGYVFLLTFWQYVISKHFHFSQTERTVPSSCIRYRCWMGKSTYCHWSLSYATCMILTLFFFFWSLVSLLRYLILVIMFLFHILKHTNEFVMLNSFIWHQQPLISRSMMLIFSTTKLWISSITTIFGKESCLSVFILIWLFCYSKKYNLVWRWYRFLFWV
jgi:hypothetical protein